MDPNFNAPNVFVYTHIKNWNKEPARQQESFILQATWADLKKQCNQPNLQNMEFPPSSKNSIIAFKLLPFTRNPMYLAKVEGFGCRCPSDFLLWAGDSLLDPGKNGLLFLSFLQFMVFIVLGIEWFFGDI